MLFIGVIPLALLVLFHVKNALISRENRTNNICFNRGERCCSPLLISFRIVKVQVLSKTSLSRPLRSVTMRFHATGIMLSPCVLARVHQK